MRLINCILLITIAVLACLSNAQAVTQWTCSTTGASTTWTDPAAWTNCNGVYPQNNASNTYAANILDTHSVTIPYGSTITVGHDQAGVAAIQGNTTGNLTVNGTLRFKGLVFQGNSTWNVNANGSSTQGRLEHAGTTSFYWQIGSATNQANAILKLNGNGPNSGRVVVTNYTGAARFDGFMQGNTNRHANYTPNSGSITGGNNPTITQFSDYSGTVAGTVQVTTSANNGLTNGNSYTLNNAGVYSGTYTITTIDTSHFYITATYKYSYASVNGAGRLEAAYTTFQSIGTDNGTTGNDWLTANLGYSGNKISLDHCLVDDSSAIVVVASSDTYALNDAAYFSITNTSFTNAYSNNSLITKQKVTGSSPTANHLVIQNSVVEGMNLVYGRGWNVTNSIIYSKIGTAATSVPLGNTSGTQYDTFDNVILWNRNTGGTGWSQMPTGLITRLISIVAYGQDNLRKNADNTTTNSYASHINGCLVENGNPAGGAGANTSFIYYDDRKSAEDNVLENCIEIPYYGTTTNYQFALQGWTTIESGGGTENAGFHLTVRNNTRIAGIGSTLSFMSDLEYNPHVGLTGTYQGIYNNLTWSPATATGNVVVRTTAYIPVGVTGIWQNNDYNTFYNVTGSQYTPDVSYFANPSPPGTHDRYLTGTSTGLFFDPTYNMLRWAKTIDNSITDYATILTRMLKMNDDSGYDARFFHLNYYNAARAAFTPQLPSLGTTGYLGGYVGAVPPANGIHYDMIF